MKYRKLNDKIILIKLKIKSTEKQLKLNECAKKIWPARKKSLDKEMIIVYKQKIKSRCSVVVAHSLGKGGVVSPILTSGTTFPLKHCL